MIAPADKAAPWITGDGPRRAATFTVAAICLFLITKASWAAGTGSVTQVPWVAALFVLPLAFALPGPRRFLARNRWPVLAVQAVLTWVPFAVFGGYWVPGIGGLLAALVLLMLPARVAWPSAGLLLAADVTVRAMVTGMPGQQFTPAWSGIVWTVLVFADDALASFGIVRLAQTVGDVEEARTQAADLAVARERLQAARSLHAAIGQRLAGVASMTAAARRALRCDPALAREQLTAAGVTAREAVARARAVTADRHGPLRPEPAAAPAGSVVIGARLAWAVMVVMLLAYAAQGLNNVFVGHNGPSVGAALAASIALAAALQLRHSRTARNGRRPRAWPVTLGVQAALAYMFFVPPLAAYTVAAPFLAASVLLLVPGRWRWAGLAAIVISWPTLYALVPLRGITAADRGAFLTFYQAATIAFFALVTCGLTWLAGLARQLEDLRGELARMAAVRERLRVTRDTHDLLGLGLSAVALKTDLAGALIGRDNTRAAAELAEINQICAAARADIRLVTGERLGLPLAGELAAAGHLLGSAGIQARVRIPAAPLPAAADVVLAPVLREAITNIVRHATARTCLIEVSAGQGRLRLHISNDGVTRQPGPARPADGGGHGLANLKDRVQDAGGCLDVCQAGDRFDLTADIPVPSTGHALARLAGLRSLLPPRRQASQPGIDHPLAPGDRTDRADEPPARPVLEQASQHANVQRGG